MNNKYSSVHLPSGKGDFPGACPTLHTLKSCLLQQLCDLKRGAEKCGV